jgi:deazaflavin-dependent oxidoreductase (nitroreductase family)
MGGPLIVPSDRALRTMNTLHHFVLRVSGGRLGWRAGGMPVLELTTIGRKSGEPRTAMLTSPLQVGDSYVVVASRGGDDVHPAWYLNLRENPEVQVVITGRPSETRRARVATPEERATLWPQITAGHPNYAAYQRRTSREIPLVLLERI